MKQNDKNDVDIEIAKDAARVAHRERWATPLAASFTVLHCLAIFANVGWWYFGVPQYKKIFNDFGMELSSMAVLEIQASDAFVNYWYALVPVVGAAAFADFLLLRWTGRDLGSGYVFAFGICLTLLLLTCIGIPWYALRSEFARLLQDLSLLDLAVPLRLAVG